MIRLSLFTICLILFQSSQMPATTDWRGLAPLKSTRMDVERALGPPDQSTDSDELLTYRFTGMEVHFFFTSNPNCQQQVPYTSWNVTPDTLTGIDVYLRPQPLVADTGIDLTKYKKIEPASDLLNRYIYLNDDSSFAIEVGNNYLAGYHYQPGTNHKDLRCEARKKP